jgi:dephospho-CoA kinase
VIDAALLVDMGVKDLVDALIVVIASPDARRKRLITRGMTAADIDARMAAQVSGEKLMERADIVVTNDRSLEHLTGEADRAWQEIQARKATKARRRDT